MLDGSFFNTKIRGCGVIGSISVFQIEGAGSYPVIHSQKEKAGTSLLLDKQLNIAEGHRHGLLRHGPEVANPSFGLCIAGGVERNDHTGLISQVIAGSLRSARSRKRGIPRMPATCPATTTFYQPRVD